MEGIHKVSSSNVDRVGYRRDSSSLLVVFKSGTGYVYSGVPEHIADELLKAPSKGTFFGKNIRDKFATAKLADQPEEAIRVFQEGAYGTKRSSYSMLSECLRPGVRPLGLFA